MSVIDLQDVRYALPGGWTLFEGVTFRVPPGHHAALVGANGIGKSTLLRLVAGLEPPSAGAVNVPGRVGRVHPRPRRACAARVRAHPRRVGGRRGLSRSTRSIGASPRSTSTCSTTCAR